MMKKNEEPTIRYILYVGKQLVFKDSFLDYRPDPETRFPIFGAMFYCVNKTRIIEPNNYEEPVVAVLLGHGNNHENIEVFLQYLLKHSFEAVAENDIKDIMKRYFAEEMVENL